MNCFKFHQCYFLSRINAFLLQYLAMYVSESGDDHYISFPCTSRCLARTVLLSIVSYRYRYSHPHRDASFRQAQLVISV